MAKKLSFDKLPEAVERILEILNSEDSSNTTMRLLVGRMALLESKIDHLEKSLSPNRPTMDKPAVLKVLKIRPKMLAQLEMSGVLPSHTEGRKTLFYEADVVKFFMTQPQWAARTAAKNREESAAEPNSPHEQTEERHESELQVVPAVGKGAGSWGGARPVAQEQVIRPDGRQKVDINGASAILRRTTGAIRQQLHKDLPHYKDGHRIYFYSDELRAWDKTHFSRKRKKRGEK